jgi:hypothetical protein
MSKRAVCVAVALALAWPVPGAAQASKPKATITVQNKSAHDIHHLYLTPSDHDDWGTDQLGDHVIDARKGSFKITGIPCGTYDVRLVDQEGDECVVEEVDICAAKETWTINDKDLRACQGWEE